ncbi:MAG: 1-acyl-sn-glycerol-3-phosphate acyltransferase [Oscillospiraceae bacterium]|nr:1-acyl-sn-glycerol-3-phosphate acyltransferase [Oscillospiraceae bacterium]
MVRYIVLALILLIALGVCAGVDGFCGLGWLWILPVCILGSAVALIVVYFLTLWISSLLVNIEKPQKKDNPFYRWLVQTTASLGIWILRIRVRTRGLEQLPKSGRFMLVCNHLSLLDPLILLNYCKKSQLAFIAKRESASMFLVGKLMHRMMCQLINRENDREALKTIINCIRMIQEDKVSVAVFPEGYITGDDLLHPFRSGVFKIAQKANVPIVVCTLQNTQEVKRNMPHLRHTDVAFHLLGVIQPEDFAGMTTVDIGNKVHAMMAEDLGPDLVFQENP